MQAGRFSGNIDAMHKHKSMQLGRGGQNFDGQALDAGSNPSMIEDFNSFGVSGGAASPDDHQNI